MLPLMYSSLAGTLEYNTWNNLKSRCTNSNHPQWKDYGGRGITVCDRWVNSFDDFIADVGRSPGPEYSIDRKDNSKGYEPGNVRWATRVEQARNSRRNHLITFRGQTLCAAEWAEKFNLGCGKKIIDRLALGWSIADAITIPIGSRKRPRAARCKHGHAYTPENTYTRTYPPGHKRAGQTHQMCRACGIANRARRTIREQKGSMIELRGPGELL